MIGTDISDEMKRKQERGNDICIVDDEIKPPREDGNREHMPRRHHRRIKPVSSLVSSYTVSYLVSSQIAVRPFPYKHATRRRSTHIALISAPIRRHRISSSHGYTDDGNRATPRIRRPCPHTLITPMTSSINHTTPRRMSIARPADTNRIPSPPDGTTRRRGIHEQRQVRNDAPRTADAKPHHRPTPRKKRHTP